MDTHHRRLQELAADDVCHSWMWALTDKHGPVMAQDEYIDAIRLRIGAAGPVDPCECKLCGKVMDSSGSHALL